MAAGTLLIVDDHEAVRTVVGSYLSSVAGWGTVLTAPDAGRGLMIAAERQAIVLDHRMAGGNGLDVLPDLRRACPSARIVMHTTEDSPELWHEALSRGADAMVPKGRPLDELAAELDRPHVIDLTETSS